MPVRDNQDAPHDLKVDLPWNLEHRRKQDFRQANMQEVQVDPPLGLTIIVHHWGLSRMLSENPSMMMFLLVR